MPTVTIKLSPAEHARLKADAARRRTSKSAVLREAYASSSGSAASGSFLERAKHLIGAASGPGDLSTNSKYLAGYGKSRHS